MQTQTALFTSKHDPLLVIKCDLYISISIEHSYRHLLCKSKNALQEHFLEDFLARRSHYPVDAVALEDAQPAQLVTLGLVEPQDLGVVARVHRREERGLCGA